MVADEGCSGCWERGLSVVVVGWVVRDGCRVCWERKWSVVVVGWVVRGGCRVCRLRCWWGEWMVEGWNRIA